MNAQYVDWGNTHQSFEESMTKTSYYFAPIPQTIVDTVMPNLFLDEKRRQRKDFPPMSRIFLWFPLSSSQDKVLQTHNDAFLHLSINVQGLSLHNHRADS